MKRATRPEPRARRMHPAHFRISVAGSHGQVLSPEVSKGRPPRHPRRLSRLSPPRALHYRRPDERRRRLSRPSRRPRSRRRGKPFLQHLREAMATTPAQARSEGAPRPANRRGPDPPGSGRRPAPGADARTPPR